MAVQWPLSLLVFALLNVVALSDRSLYDVEVVSKSTSRPILPNGVSATISRVIVVDVSGRNGQFKSVQQAINSIPSNNKDWVEIRVKAGIYREKVKIPLEKPNISIVGEGRETTIIEWSDGGGSQTIEYSTFQVYANNIVVKDITFKNTYQAARITQAPATLIYGDKVSFYGCGFVGVQDTLTDFVGRHYFQGCYVQGYIDFIWGYGQSIYKDCTINVTSGPYNDKIYGAGYITAQGRSPDKTTKGDNHGYVFTYCKVVGTSRAFLGRPYKTDSKVVFYKNYLSDAVVSQGWSYNLAPSQLGSIINEEVECTGPGASKTKRARLGKSLSKQELDKLISLDSFINYDHWIEKQPR
ncbi:hypothetical protein RND81_09G244400 [Saponaria officinalis]|uniref:Pectinesterase n=1 Tax=Saponaria officinalis TaxID=3572 RepID=A0AAW1IQN5_SAPOF